MFQSIGQKIIHLESVDSTNNYAASLLLEEKEPCGTVILADTQTAGRGQRGAEWASKPGENLLMSLILDTDKLSVLDQFVVSEVTALSIVSFLRKIGISAQIKWPNDVLVNERKISGVLIENQLKGSKLSSSIIGIGLNVNQLVFEGLSATSIRKECGQFMPIKEMMFSLIHSFNEEWEKFISLGRGKVEEEYLSKMYGTSKPVQMEDESSRFMGLIQDVERSGRIRVLKNGELRSYDLKEVRFIYQSNPSI